MDCTFRKQAQAAKAEAEKEGIIVPTTLEEYCIKSKTKPSSQEPQVSATQSLFNGIYKIQKIYLDRRECNSETEKFYTPYKIIWIFIHKILH